MSLHTNHPDDFSEIHLIPYTHTDYSWTNSRNWHIWRYLYGFRHALEIMREEPKFTYMIDNVHHSWLAFERYCPELLAEFAERVKEGRFVIANGGWALARPNYTGDEAYVRNLIEGKRFFDEKFDIPDAESHFFFNADTAIGHSQLPQILALTGNKYYRANRPSETMNHKGIPRQFVWKGLDGSEVIVARGEYGGLFYTDYFDKYPDMDKDWEHILEEYWQIEEKNASNSESDKLMLFFGCDDVIPGCNLVDRPIPYHAFMDTWTRRQAGRMFLSTPGRYFAALEAERDTLPVVKGVLDHCDLSYNIPFKGQQSLWYRRRLLERLILRLESLRSMLAAYGIPCPNDDIRALWLDLLSISGHALEYVLVGDIEAIEAQGDEAILRSGRLIHETENLIAEHIVYHGNIDELITAYTVINPLPEAREEVVKLHVTTPYGFDSIRLEDTEGNILPYQVTEVFIADKPYARTCNSADLLVRVKLPAAGWTTVTAYPCDDPLPYTETELDDYHATYPLGRDDAPLTVDTGAIKVTFQSGQLIEVEHGGRRITGNFGHLSFSQFKPKSLTWTAIWGDTEDYAFIPSAWGLIRNGKLRYIYRVKGTIGTAQATMDITLDRGSPRIDYSVTLDCEKNEGIFTASFPCDTDTELYADVPYGIEHRDLSSEPSSECQGHCEDPSHYFFWESAWRGQFFARNFALFRVNGVDTALISDTCSMYYSLRRDLGTVSLLLNGQHDMTVHSDNRTDKWIRLVSPSFLGLGSNTFAFSYCPFDNVAQDELFHKVMLETKYLHVKPTSVPQFGFTSAGTLPLHASALMHDGAHVILTANYIEDDAWIIRGYESAGIGGQVQLRITGEFGEAYKTDLLGNRLPDAVTCREGEIIFDTHAWEIFTIKMPINADDLA